MSERAIDPLNRRVEPGQLKGFLSEFVKERDRAIGSLISDLSLVGEFDENLLKDSELSKYDERVVEYAMAWDYVIKLNKGWSSTLCDVGCVLNNQLISETIIKHVSFLSLINPSLENLVYKENFAYFLGDIRSMSIPSEWQFDCVTCLSTLEHMGMDNTRYGGECADFKGEIKNPEKYAVQGVRAIRELVKVGGSLLLSVPFGPFEFLYVHGQPDKPIYYTFDKKRLLKLVEPLVNFDVKLTVFFNKRGEGWYRGDIDDYNDYYKHAQGCASAGAVAFVEAIRKF